MSNTINSQSANSLVNNNEDSAFNIGGLSGVSTASSKQPSVALLQNTFSQQFSKKAADHEGFHKMMRQSFNDKGKTYNYKGAEALRQKVLAGDVSWLPEVKVLSGSEFSQAQLFHQGQASGSESFLGAFGDETIFLSESILSDPNIAFRVFSEEVGHAIDQQLNPESDTAGDEGAIFSALLRGESLSAEQMQALKSENDQGMLVGVEVEFLSDSGDSIIAQINADRTAAAEKTNASNVAAAGAGETIAKIEPELLTAAEKQDAKDMFAQFKADGLSGEDAAKKTKHYMEPENAWVRRELRARENNGELATDIQSIDEDSKKLKGLSGVINDIEISNKTLGSISKGFDFGIKKLNELGTPEAKAAALALGGGKAILDALAAADKGETQALGEAKAIKIILKQTGLTFSQLMKKIGSGDLAAFGAVMTDIGSTYETFIKDSPKLQDWAAGTHMAGTSMIATGHAVKSKEMIASGEYMLATANFIGHWDFNNKDGKPAANTFTRMGDGMTLAGSFISTTGKLIGDKELTEVGGYVKQGTQFFGYANTLHKLYTTPINFEEVGIVAGTAQGNINADTAADTGIKTLSAALDFSAMIIDDKDAAEALTQTSDIVENGYGLYEAITDGGSKADIAAAGITLLSTGLKIADVEIPPEVQKMITLGLTALKNSAAEEGPAALTKFLAPHIVSMASNMGITLTEKAVTEALGTIGTVAGIVYAVVKLGFDISDIAENDTLTDIKKTELALQQVTYTALTIGVTNFYNPVGWIAFAVAGVTNDAAAIIDTIENGPDANNISRLAGGPLGGVIADLVFPPDDPDSWIVTTDNGGRPLPPFDEDGFYLETEGDGARIWMQSPFGTNRMSIHHLEGVKDNAKIDIINKFKPLLTQVKTTDESLASALNAADEQNGQAGLSMSSYLSSLGGDNPIKHRDELKGIDAKEMVDYRYGRIGDRVANSGSKAGIAFNTWLDGLDDKVIDDSGDTFTISDVIAKVPALLTMSPEIIDRILNTIEPGTLKHVIAQFTNTAATYLAALGNPVVQDSIPQNDPLVKESQTLDLVIDKLGLTEDYRFTVAPETEGIPQRVKDFVSHLNEMGGHGTVKLMGQGVQMGKDPEKNYQLVVNGERDAYRFVDGDTPYFMKMSRAVVDLSGDFGDWPPQGVVDWGPLDDDKNANPLHNGTELIRQGNHDHVKPYDPVTLEGLTGSEKNGLKMAEALTAGLQDKGKDVKLLGVSKFDGHFEVLVEGKQHAYKLEDGGDRFVQVSQRKLQTDTPGNVQKFHANLNRIREKEGKEGVQLVSRSEDGKTYQLIVDGEQNTYRYVENIEYDYSNGSRIASVIDNSYYEKDSRTEANADWPPHHAVNWSDKKFQASREGNLIQWVKPDNTLSDQENKGLGMAQALVGQQRLNGQDVKLLGVSSKTQDDTFELLVEGKQHAYKMVNDGENFKFVQVTQTRLYAKAEPELAASTAPETTLPLADGNAAFMAGNYQGVIDYVNQNPSSGADQQILDTYKQAAEHGLELEQAIAKGDYGEIAAKLKSISDGLKLVAPELSNYYGTGATLASQADIIIDSILSGNYTLAKSMAEGFLKTLGEHPEFTEKFQSIVDLARYVIDVSNLYSKDGNLTAAAEQADEYAGRLPEGELKTAFGAIANNIRNEESAGILILAGNTALTAGNYQGIITHITAMTGPNTATDQAVIDAYEDSANIGLKMEQALTTANQTLSTESYAKAATYFGFLADKLQPFAPEVANDYRVGETLTQTASTITQAVQSGDYPGAIAAAQSYQAILADNPDIGEKFPTLSSLFGPATNLANHVVLIAEHYNAGNLTGATQLAETYANTLPSGGLKDAFSNIIAEIIKTEDAKAA